MTILIEEVTDLTHPHMLRRTVFMGEQNVSEEEEMDDLDDQAIHILAMDDGVPVGTSRILLEGEVGVIGRVCIAKSARGSGLGKSLMQASIQRLQEIDGVCTAKLGAQLHAIGFYEKIGFRAFGEEYDDAGIAHRWMSLEL